MAGKDDQHTESQDVKISRPPETSQGKETDFQITQRLMLANMRHELRTPLNAIIGYSEMLLEDIEDPHQGGLIQDLQKICSAGKEMLGIVNGILDPSNIETDQEDIDWDGLEAKLAHALRTPLNTVIGYSEMVLEERKDGDKDFIIDLRKIRAASKRFLPLIKEIVKFSKMEAGVTAIDIENPEVSEMIRGVVKAIRPHQKDDKPVTAVNRSAILVVDDNDMNRDLLSRYLERQGHTLTAAKNGSEALHMVETHEFDMILLDVLMPEMNGYQVLQRLKENEAWRDIPVIMISAMEELDSVVRCIEMGADDYLSKPFDPVLLKARTNNCLAKKRLNDLEKEQKRILKETFGKYVDREIRDEVLSGRIPLDGETKDVTVLFSDLRNFTPLTESTPPKEVVKILNGYFAAMAPVISRHSGSIMRYVGDEVYAVFGAPIYLDNHPRHAVEAALDMRRLLILVNKNLEAQGYTPLRHGIGIHSGLVVAANIGSPDRLSYDMVGDTVNLASRIQDLTKTYHTDILISGATRARLGDDFVVEKVKSTVVKGRKEPVEIFKVL